MHPVGRALADYSPLAGVVNLASSLVMRIRVTKVSQVPDRLAPAAKTARAWCEARKRPRHVMPAGPFIPYPPPRIGKENTHSSPAAMMTSQKSRGIMCRVCLAFMRQSTRDGELAHNHRAW